MKKTSSSFQVNTEISTRDSLVVQTAECYPAKAETSRIWCKIVGVSNNLVYHILHSGHLIFGSTMALTGNPPSMAKKGEPREFSQLKSILNNNSRSSLYKFQNPVTQEAHLSVYLQPELGAKISN